MAQASQPTPRPQFPDREPQRLRFSEGLPVPRDRYEFDWAKERKEWRDWSVADVVLACAETSAWNRRMVPACEAVDAGRGPSFLYSAIEYELALLAGRLLGCKTMRELRLVLADDDHERERILLGFTEDRTWCGPKRVRRVGVPSEGSLCRHRQRLPEALRLEILREVFRDLRDELLAVADPDEFDLLFMDGTELPTHWTTALSRRRRRPSERIRNPITCLEGGSRRGVDGFQAVALTAPHGICLEYEIAAINESESRLAVEVIKRYQQDIAPKLPSRRRVGTTDAAFNYSPLRAAMRRAGIVDNIQIHSGKEDPKTIAQVERAKKDRIPIRGYPDWIVNGFREPRCRCGGGTVSKRIDSRPDGSVSVRLEGRCKQCGPISLTSGDWRRTTNTNAPMVRKQRHEDPDDFDVLGTPLTYRDKVSRVYRNKRMGLNEGFFGALSQRTGWNRDKSWYRTRAQAEIALLETLIPLTALAILRKKIARGQAAVAPPRPRRVRRDRRNPKWASAPPGTKP